MPLKIEDENVKNPYYSSWKLFTNIFELGISIGTVKLH